MTRPTGVALLLAACGQPVYPVGTPVALQLDATCVPAAFADTIRVGAHYWDVGGGRFMLDGEPGSDAAAVHLTVTCAAELPDEGGGEWTGAVVLRSDLLTADVLAYAGSRQVVAEVVAHELGHAMGLQHTPQDLHAVMYPTANGATLAPDATDLAQLQETP